ncbi:MAG: NINE protein [Wolinella sp.]
MEEKVCNYCAAKIAADAVICTSCGRQVEELKVQTIVVNNAAPGEEKNKWVALLLCFFVGWLGIHRFYEGKTFTGILYFFTLGAFFGGFWELGH